MPLLDPAILERQASARAPRDLSDGQRAVLKRAELLDPDDAGARRARRSVDVSSNPVAAQ
jgi:hypothetical protein